MSGEKIRDLVFNVFEPFRDMTEEAKFGLLALFALAVFIFIASFLGFNQSIIIGTFFGTMIALVIWSATINSEGHINKNEDGQKNASK